DGGPEGENARWEARQKGRVRLGVAQGRQPKRRPLKKGAKAAAGKKVYEVARTRKRCEPIREPSSEVNHSQVGWEEDDEGKEIAGNIMPQDHDGQELLDGGKG